jgi:uncharacterized membrane protein
MVSFLDLGLAVIGLIAILIGIVVFLGLLLTGRLTMKRIRRLADWIWPV